MTPEQTRDAALIFNQLAKNLLDLSEVFLQVPSVPITNTVVKEETTTTTKRVEKKKKDPNAPKRHLSSYMLYSQDVRPNTAKQHPDFKQPDIARLIGDKWNKLSDKEKAPYIKAAEKEKKRYDDEMEKYKATLNDGEVISKRKAVDDDDVVPAAVEEENNNNNKENNKKKHKKNKQDKKDEKSSSSKKKKSEKKTTSN